jgi:thiamine-phosphate pyrophosphorylase
VDVALLRGRPVGEVVRSLAEAGAEIVQLRAKGLPDRDLLRAAREAVEAAHGVGARLIVNDRPDVALLCGADGVHVGQDDLDPVLVRRILPNALVGFSTHDAAQVAIADALPVDYIAVGPVFATTSKERPDPVVGPALLVEARRLTRRPLVAIGGIQASNVGEVRAAGASGLAVLSAVLGAPDPGAAFRALRSALDAGA